jgi:hypothetical protein
MIRIAGEGRGQGRGETRSWRSELQRRLDREALVTMEVVSGDESLAVTDEDLAASTGLSFGPYGVSPLHGLHFDNAHDTAAS